MKTGLQGSPPLGSREVQSHAPCYKANKSSAATVELLDVTYLGERELGLQCMNLGQGKQTSIP